MADLPRLGVVLVAVVREAVKGPDRWARVDLPPDWPLEDLVERVSTSVAGLRLGVLRPFGRDAFASLVAETSDDPSEITRWRNARDAPTLVLGEALGREEAGLRAAKRIVTVAEVLDVWRSELLSWIDTELPAEPPKPFVTYLFELCGEGTIDAVRLDEYIGEALSDSSGPLARMRSDLWRLNLLPDSRVLDTGVARSRLALNLQVRQLLLSATDTPSDLKGLERLRKAAADGNAAARVALEYRETRDRGSLRTIELDTIVQILSPRRPPRPRQPRPLDLFDFLDASSSASQQAMAATLRELAQAWELEALDSIELVASIDLGDEAARDVRVEVRPVPVEETPWTGDGSAQTQVVTYLAHVDAERDWIPAPGDAISGARLGEVAAAQDRLVGSAVFEPLVEEYLAARARVGPFERWLRESAFPLLLLHETARDAVRDFLAAWSALANAASELEPGDAEVIRNAIVLLETVWGQERASDGATHYEWCILGPLHPYVLDPLLRIANYTLGSSTAPELGTKTAWAIDRSIPAYRVVWAPTTSLFLSRRDDRFEFQSTPASDRPSTNSGDGVYQIAKAFLGFHPFAQEALVITVIDPPPGGALIKNLRRLEKEVGELRVFLVTTSGDAAQLEEAGDLVANLGRFATIEEWLERAPARSHLAFYFAGRPPGTVVAARSGWGPTPGAHVALQIRIEASAPFESPERLTPFVSFEPRERNSPVVALQKLAAPSLGSPRLFEVQPMLEEEETSQIARLARVSDWVVIAAPAPLGLIAPRDLGETVTYLGRESLGVYGLFIYATSLFSIRRLFTHTLRRAGTPLIPNAQEVERRLTELALESPNGVLRIGRSRGGIPLWEQVGVIASSTFSRSLDS